MTAILFIQGPLQNSCHCPYNYIFFKMNCPADTSLCRWTAYIFEILKDTKYYYHARLCDRQKNGHPEITLRINIIKLKMKEEFHNSLSEK